MAMDSLCYLHHRLDFAKAEVSSLSLQGSYLRARLSARQIQVARTLNLSTGFRCDGGVVLQRAHVGGQLNCTRAVFQAPGGWALDAYGLAVGEDMVLYKSQCAGSVRLREAHVGGQLHCFEAVFQTSGDWALDAYGLVVGGDIALYEAQFVGPVLLVAARIGRGLICTKGVFSNPHGTALYIKEPAALYLEELTVGATMYLAQAQFIGQVLLSGVHIGGLLSCEEAAFVNPGGHALVADRLTGAAVGCRSSEVRVGGQAGP
jgi:hypothetical protein